jgi:hypothetical protein
MFATRDPELTELIALFPYTLVHSRRALPNLFPSARNVIYFVSVLASVPHLIIQRDS